jgi:hypothetical protein
MSNHEHTHNLENTNENKETSAVRQPEMNYRNTWNIEYSETLVNNNNIILSDQNTELGLG